MSKSGQIIGIKEFSQALGISVAQMWRLRNPRSPYFDPRCPKGFRPGLRGRKLLFNRSEVDQYINVLRGQ